MQCDGSGAKPGALRRLQTQPMATLKSQGLTEQYLISQRVVSCCSEKLLCQGTHFLDFSFWKTASWSSAVSVF